ncbi:hypothetical protein BCV70DRAFT_203296 [Testicularia cyperi]|uniref:tRNA-splicing endonuclease subunit Sen54 N-terminal domain-containing protein n=1 Tax=Testicularia cyperi TaxID=1882483 RepID=A0A317XET3_9BASI|nr:hypothetical protein BCV70DRAFT_203296 [Testicularia cyperi]
MLGPESDLDDPTTSASGSGAGSSNAKSGRAVGASASEAGGAGGGDSDDGEEEAPDYLRLLSMTSKSTSGSNIIPKRGEKDFEPTGFGGQAKLLERSRQAMYQAVSGERRIGARSLVRATWIPRTSRAVLHDVQGKIFETVGIITRTTTTSTTTGADGAHKLVTKTRNELLPEEALFLMERGSLQLYSLPISSSSSSKSSLQSEEEAWDGQLNTDVQPPMSLQQAYAQLMDKNHLSREKYLVYAYLKRLGYVVQRASVVDAIRAAPLSSAMLARSAAGSKSKTNLNDATQAQTRGIIADPQRPIRLVKIWDLLLYIPRRVAQLGGDAVEWLLRRISAVSARIGAALARLVNSVASRSIHGPSAATLLGGAARNRGLLGSPKWDSYDAVFRSLQIVPSGHDFFLPPQQSSRPASISDTVTLQARPPPPHGPSSDTLAELEPFYYAWRPATVYRKSHPPTPEFRIVVVDARVQGLPDVWQFGHIFSSVPIPGSDQELFGVVDLQSSSSSSTANVGASGGGAGGGQETASIAASTAATMDENEREARLEYERNIKRQNEAKNRAAYGKFSAGKMRFLATRAEERKKASLLKRHDREAQMSTPRLYWTRFWASSLGMYVWKAAKLEFRLVKGVARVFCHSPPGCFVGAFSTAGRRRHHHHNDKSGNRSSSSSRGGGGGAGTAAGSKDTRPVNVFPPLKAGRRTVVLAVVDGSISTLLRFGESEFAAWKLAGTQALTPAQQPPSAPQTPTAPN